ncbi:hypothetical protein BX600DRAFT_92000 [Xylariales sp. PMI_506]|nr:hypothetical protein BX600DRAFT_92000 [Xylariales sp. PMI_506]
MHALGSPPQTNCLVYLLHMATLPRITVTVFDQSGESGPAGSGKSCVQSCHFTRGKKKKKVYTVHGFKLFNIIFICFLPIYYRVDKISVGRAAGPKASSVRLFAFFSLLAPLPLYYFEAPSSEITRRDMNIYLRRK